ncbi:type II toxin-antitoxin system HicB family antitoxin [Hespellia stercorisuis]|uniref:Predicted nuclease of the RNAse H fold, HicB family n=1 Tax=Hespellia stercorisuis DSM 15480 TaxID=1121950 RepID=A0A1M6MK75_9FIRM|nr:type II toxin-antitoxin system HicB family antitoxin [Hespellia stercorisuis]SHJ83868.1 Predicted nuclease of the RNAse H fold, HicB family [Hespellia stercorisuis DSM 15480]
MKFIYPAVFHQDVDGSYKAYFPDLESCFAEGADLDDAIDNANDAARDWISLELDDPDGNLPHVSDEHDLDLKDGEFMRNISVNIRFHVGWDE